MRPAAGQQRRARRKSSSKVGVLMESRMSTAGLRDTSEGELAT